MALGSIASMAKWTGVALQLFSFLGTPIIALAVGVLFAVWQIAAVNKLDKFYEITNDTLKIVGPILFITAAGGVLGRVIASTSIVAFITANAKSIATIGIFFPFILSAILKTAQGYSTVALVTTAGIVAPLLGTLGLDSPARTALAVMSIATGAMTVAHANDSYFWVVTNFGGMTPEKGYKTQTAATLVEGLCAMAGVFILSLILR
jgi:GntP family gluconate:H+ symporter